ncbi:hypothetical protein PAL_GLEAN10025754 [Pteropus alecto]|uniref:Uncharacterized protein n=1 Tax=Pteropus alecto TaxID=9402 RepID=L5K202_PTEAL|nr:hypothetical protein PAL_GLEAN10025754 [Pteropus alecto]
MDHVKNVLSQPYDTCPRPANPTTVQLVAPVKLKLKLTLRVGTVGFTRLSCNSEFLLQHLSKC